MSFVKNHINVLSCIVGTDGGCHSSLGCVICQKSYKCFVMYCGDRQGCHSSLVCVICQKNIMYVRYVRRNLVAVGGHFQVTSESKRQ